MNRFELLKYFDNKEDYDNTDKTIKDILSDADKIKMEEYIFNELRGMRIDEVEDILRRIK